MPDLTEPLTYFLADLHVHTVLSPCAEIEMQPPLIMERARQQGLTLLAVTDHNSSENAGAMIEAGAVCGIRVLPGMEVQTREEVHLLCLFDQLEEALEWQKLVYQHLPPIKNREEVFGAQLVVDAEGEFVHVQERLLLTSTDLTIEQVFGKVQASGGLVIPAHVDRPSYSLIANLGMIPEGIASPAVEISPHISPKLAKERFPQIRDRTLVQNSDAHRLSELCARTLAKIQKPTIEELRKACEGIDGRKIILE